MEEYMWYQQLVRPEWAPPAYLFGPVWTVLYVGICISFAAVFILAVQKKIPRTIVWPFALNLVCNVAFTPIQFGLQNNVLAAIDVLLVFATLIWGIVSIYPVRKWIAYMQIPYLLWVSFASVLQLTITYLNW